MTDLGLGRSRARASVGLILAVAAVVSVRRVGRKGVEWLVSGLVGGCCVRMSILMQQPLRCTVVLGGVARLQVYALRVDFAEAVGELHLYLLGSVGRHGAEQVGGAVARVAAAKLLHAGVVDVDKLLPIGLPS